VYSSVLSELMLSELMLSELTLSELTLSELTLSELLSDGRANRCRTLATTPRCYRGA